MEINPDFPRESRSHIMLGLGIGFFTVTTFIISSRIYIRARISKAIGWDDYLAVAAYVLLTVTTGLDITSELNGAGTSINQLNMDQIRLFFTLSPIGMLLYFIVVGLVRLSILAFLPRLNRDVWYLRCVWILGIVIVTVTLAAFFYVLTECKPIIDVFSPDRPMKNCRPQKYEADVMYIHAISGVVIDIALFSLPIWVIRKTMTFSRNVIQVTLVFAVGFFAIIISIVRVVVLFETDYAVNTTYKIFWVGTWSMIELHIGLWCGSFPALQPLVRFVAYKLNLTSHDDSNKLSVNTNTFATPDHDRPEGNLYMRHGSASQQSTGSSAGGILGRDGNTSSGESTTEIVEMDRVNDLRGTRMFMDMRVSIENGKRSYVRERTEFKEPWDAV